jgi:hypothetical protein
VRSSSLDFQTLPSLILMRWWAFAEAWPLVSRVLSDLCGRRAATLLDCADVTQVAGETAKSVQGVLGNVAFQHLIWIRLAAAALPRRPAASRH